LTFCLGVMDTSCLAIWAIVPGWLGLSLTSVNWNNFILNIILDKTKIILIFAVVDLNYEAPLIQSLLPGKSSGWIKHPNKWITYFVLQKNCIEGENLFSSNFLKGFFKRWYWCHVYLEGLKMHICHLNKISIELS
jgi:hypothetical protein